jgi:mercuric ion transport protein
MKKLIIVNFLLIIFMLLNGCGKKEKTITTEVSNSNSTQTELVEFKCANMHCSGCEESIKSEVNKLEGVKEIIADAKNKTVKVTFIKDVVNKEKIEKAINVAGYDTETSKSEKKHNCDME